MLCTVDRYSRLCFAYDPRWLCLCIWCIASLVLFLLTVNLSGLRASAKCLKCKLQIIYNSSKSFWFTVGSTEESLSWQKELRSSTSSETQSSGTVPERGVGVYWSKSLADYWDCEVYTGSVAQGAILVLLDFKCCVTGPLKGTRHPSPHWTTRVNSSLGMNPGNDVTTDRPEELPYFTDET